jgi:large subunit ribosomal protein L25
MKEVILKADIREELGSRQVKVLRKSGFIPAVFYSGKKSQALKIDRFSLVKFLHEHKDENVIINLKIAEDAKKSKDNTVMIKDIQYDPVTEEIVHLDFNKISLTESISVRVSVEAKGEPAGVKEDGGVLEHILWELEIECLPKDIPKSIEVDVSNLRIGDAVHIKDIKLPGAVKVKHEPEAIVLSVAPPAKEEVAPAEEVLEAEAAAEPEVIREKKEEAPGDGAGAKEDKSKQQQSAPDKETKGKS